MKNILNTFYNYNLAESVGGTFQNTKSNDIEDESDILNMDVFELMDFVGELFMTADFSRKCNGFADVFIEDCKVMGLDVNFVRVYEHSNYKFDYKYDFLIGQLNWKHSNRNASSSISINGKPYALRDSNYISNYLYGVRVESEDVKEDMYEKIKQALQTILKAPKLRPIFEHNEGLMNQTTEENWEKTADFRRNMYSVGDFFESDEGKPLGIVFEVTDYEIKFVTFDTKICSSDIGSLVNDTFTRKYFTTFYKANGMKFGYTVPSIEELKIIGSHLEEFNSKILSLPRGVNTEAYWDEDDEEWKNPRYFFQNTADPEKRELIKAGYFYAVADEPRYDYSVSAYCIETDERDEVNSIQKFVPLRLIGIAKL